MSHHTPIQTPNEPAIQVMTDREARGLQRSLVASKAWWVLPITNEAGIELAAAIEGRFYSGPANRDFLLLLGPLPVVFGREKRMPAVALAKLLTELRPLPDWDVNRWREVLAEQDILEGLSDEDGVEAVARLLCWHAWLGARP